MLCFFKIFKATVFGLLVGVIGIFWYDKRNIHSNEYESSFPLATQIVPCADLYKYMPDFAGVMEIDGMNIDNDDMRNIIICPIKAIVGEIADSSAYYILCSSYEQRIEDHGNAVFLHFNDTLNQRDPHVFTQEHAKKILDFFLSVPEDADVLVCCDSGESRSAAIAAALKRLQGEDDTEIWDSPEYHPNRLVYDLCCTLFDIQPRE